MDIFDTSYYKSKPLDETISYKANILTTINKKGYTEYVLQIERVNDPDEKWQVLRRYNDFVALNKSLCVVADCPTLPEKKFIGNKRPDFIAQRRIDLQEYINKVLMNPILASSLTTKKFVDPELYMTPFHELALQYASMSLRAEGQWLIGQSLGPIGWRVRKHYFKVTPKQVTTKHSPGHNTQKHHLTKSGSQTQSRAHTITSPSSSFEKDLKESPKDEYILGWTEYGPDRYVDDREINTLLKSLPNIQHPYIYPIEFIAGGDNGALMIRKFNKIGTLKDLLCGCAPINPFLTKYGSPKGRNPIPLKDLALYGRQIIEALKYLHTRGLAHGHVHAGNVVLVDGNARLLELENFFLGVPSFYRPFFIQHSRINSLESIDVYAFGHLMHELALGYPLQESCARQISDCPESLKSLLESILLKESLKGSVPSLDQLAEHRFFKEHVPTFNRLNEEIINANKPQFKIQANVKELIRLHVQKCETRLRDEQKSVKNQKRLVRVQELMTSEEKEKKHKQKQKNEQKQAKLRAQNSLQLHNGPPTVTPVMIKSDSVSSISSSTQYKHQRNVLTPPPTSSRHEFTLPSLPVASTSDKCPSDSTTVPGSSNGTKGEFDGIEGKSDESNLQRAALLESICSFKRGELRKINSN